VQVYSELEQRVQARTEQLTQANAQLGEEIRHHEYAERLLRASREEISRLSARLESIREEERKRMSREIHEGIGQQLSALNMDLAILRSKASQAGSDWDPRFESLSAQVHSLIRSVRTMAADLRPSILDDFGLPAAVEWQLEDFRRRTGVAAQFILEGAGGSEDGRRATAIFRILQEALSNVARHAAAPQVTVTLCREGGDLVLRVADTGRGFNCAGPLDGRSFGLLAMQERARQLGGQLLIASQPGQGTTITARIPAQGQPEPG
jgi:signal transduction histidine kinase